MQPLQRGGQLPPGWRQQHDPASNRVYYIDPQNTSHWEIPAAAYQQPQQQQPLAFNPARAVTPQRPVGVNPAAYQQPQQQQPLAFNPARAVTPQRPVGVNPNLNAGLPEDVAVATAIGNSLVRRQNRSQARTPERSTTPTRGQSRTIPVRAGTPPRGAHVACDKTLETRAARLALRWSDDTRCMGCDGAIGPGLVAALSSAVSRKHHCRACGWALCGNCCPDQTLPLQRWVSSTSGHPVKTVPGGGVKHKRVCIWCQQDQPGDVARAALVQETVRHEANQNHRQDQIQREAVEFQQRQQQRTYDQRQSQVEHEQTVAQLRQAAGLS
eukprot:COSAG02_NODE_2364_length_9055_cov_12.230606_4_plen_326_part_00